MSMPALIADHLVRSLASEVRAAAAGHCLRVDHLRHADARAVCRDLRLALAGDAAATFVLASAGSDTAPDDLMILPERAVELRNRKEVKLCLFVPAGVVATGGSGRSSRSRSMPS